MNTSASLIYSQLSIHVDVSGSARQAATVAVVEAISSPERSVSHTLQVSCADQHDVDQCSLSLS
jgi:hypothetical protein